MLLQPLRKRDILKPWLVFRSAITGRFVTRLWALRHPETTYSQRRGT